VVPAARGHEYVRAGRAGVVAKMGIDATVPYEERPRFTRASFRPVEVRESEWSR
jgi:2,5-furandicarboxylate decarboxylase 1